MSETVDLRPVWDAIDNIQDRRVQNMTRSAFMATIAGLTRRKEPLVDGLPSPLLFSDCLQLAFRAVVYGGNPLDQAALMQCAIGLASGTRLAEHGDLVTEMFGYAFSNIAHLAHLAAGNEPAPW